jgi:membrane protease subunit HflK
LDFVLTEGRSDVAARAAKLVQGVMDNYATGLQVTSVNMQNAQPPEEVQEAFFDAIKAREDEQRVKSEAQAYSNDVLPKARGAAARQLEEANAYKAQVVAEAEGEASRFVQVLAQYQKAPQVTRERLYLDTLESVLGSSRPIVVDIQKGGNNLFVLPLDRMLSGRVAQEDTATPAPGSMAASPPAPSRIDMRNADRLRSRSERNGSE